jgi:hypothetical protein
MFVLWVLFYRFVTGLHMDGKIRRLPQSTKVKPLFKNIWWNRTTRPRRSLIRLSVVFIFAGICIGRFADWWLTQFVLLAVTPFALTWLLRFALKRFTVVTSYSDSDGVPDRYRHLRPKYARRVRAIRGWRFRLHGPTADTIDPSTPEYRNALAEAAEDHLEPVTRISRPLGMEDMLTEVAAPEGKGRGRTIRRAVERRK